MDEKLSDVSCGEYVFSGEVTREESKIFTFSVIFPRFSYSFVMFLLVTFTIFILSGIVRTIITGDFSYLSSIPGVTFIVYAGLLLLVTGWKSPNTEYTFSENGFKTCTYKKSGKVLKEYKKDDIKKIIYKHGYVGIKVLRSLNGYFIIVYRFFENKTKYKEFIDFLENNYKEKIVRK
jgi:hypothetical protein